MGHGYINGSAIVLVLFIILVISERNNPKKLPIILCGISIVLTILSFVL